MAALVITHPFISLIADAGDTSLVRPSDWNDSHTLVGDATATSGYVLIAQGSGIAPVWSALSSIGVTSFSAGTTGLTPSAATTGAITLAGTLIAANGGTGFSSYTVGDILYANTTTTLAKLADVATGSVLASGGVGVAPSWTTLSSIGVTSFSAGTTGFTPSSATTGAITLAGTLIVANGGTGRTSLTDHSILIGAGASAINQAGPCASGGFLIWVTGTGADPTCSTITGSNAVLNGNLTMNGLIDDVSTVVPGVYTTPGFNFNDVGAASLGAFGDGNTHFAMAVTGNGSASATGSFTGSIALQYGRGRGSDAYVTGAQLMAANCTDGIGTCATGDGAGNYTGSNPYVVIGPGGSVTTAVGEEINTDLRANAAGKQGLRIADLGAGVGSSFSSAIRVVKAVTSTTSGAAGGFAEGLSFNSEGGGVTTHAISASGTLLAGGDTTGITLNSAIDLSSMAGNFTQAAILIPWTAATSFGVVYFGATGLGGKLISTNSGGAPALVLQYGSTNAILSQASQTLFSGTLTSGNAGTNSGKLSLYGVTSGLVAVAVQDAAGTFNFNLPTTAGSSGQALVSGGGGSAPMTWATILSTLTIGSTTITGGTTTRLLYDNGGVLGETAGATWTSGTNTLTVTNIVGSTGVINGSSTTGLTVNAANNTGGIAVRSGGATDLAGINIGRTGAMSVADLYFGVVGTAAQYFAETVQADSVIQAGTNLYIGTGSTAAVKVLSDDMLVKGYLNVGSFSAPTNTTAGDLTAVRGFFGGNVALATSTDVNLSIASTTTSAAGAWVSVSRSTTGAAREWWFGLTTNSINWSIYDITGALEVFKVSPTTGQVSVNYTTQATTTTDGALYTAGGLSVVKNAMVGGDGTIAGYLRVGSNTAPSNTTAGDLTAVRLNLGNVTQVQAATISGDGSLTGYLRVGSNSAPSNTTAGDFTAVRGFLSDGASISKTTTSSSSVDDLAIAMVRSTSSGAGGLFTAIGLSFIDNGSTQALSNQAISLTYVNSNTGGGSSAFDAGFNVSNSFTENLGAFSGIIIEGATVSSGKTVSNWTGINITANSGLGSVTTKVAISTNSAAGPVLVGDYLRVGSTSVPTNTTAGDITATRLSLGNVAFGSGNQLNVSGNLSGSVSTQLVRLAPEVQSGVTTTAAMIYSLPSTQATSFTITNLIHFYADQGTVGASSAITNVYGFLAGALTGSAASNVYAFHGNVASASGRYNIYMAGTAANYMAGALTVDGDLTLTNLATDATHTDRTVCQDTTSKTLYFGSGALGICLGTSGRQFKTAFAPMRAGIDELMQIPMENYRYRLGYGDNGIKMQYGPTAQSVENVLPELVGRTNDGETINYDWGGLMFVGLRAIQQLKTENDDLRARIHKIEMAA